MDIKIIRIGQEAIARYEDEDGIHKIGLGLIAFKTDAEIINLAQIEIDKKKKKDSNPPAQLPTKEEVLKEKYKTIDRTKTSPADLLKRIEALEEYLLN